MPTSPVVMFLIGGQGIDKSSKGLYTNHSYYRLRSVNDEPKTRFAGAAGRRAESWL